MTKQLHTSVSMVVHAEPKVGKTWLVGSCPKPLLIMDAEGGSRFLRAIGARVIEWDPMKEPMPVADGTWDVCVVFVRRFDVMKEVYRRLKDEEHPFRSLGIDSLTEMQKKVVDDVAGTGAPDQQDWGAILRYMEDLVRKLRDLTFHPTHPLDVVVMTSLTHLRDGKYRPMVKGQLEITLPGFPDVVGYMYVDTDEQGHSSRRLLIQPAGQFLAGDRTHVLSKVLGKSLVLRDPTNPDSDGVDVSDMLRTLEESNT